MHIACMSVTITVRDIPDETRDELAGRAARSGRSLQEYLRAELMELARRPDPIALMERVRERKLRTNTRMAAEDIVDYIAEDRP